MPGPFAGMDPYLEAQGLWESFHAALVTHCAEAINQRLPEGYVAQIETRVALVSLEIPGVQRIPDVLVGREPNAPRFPSSSSGEAVGVATIEPKTIPLARGEVEVRERWIEISSLPELELVTVIEVLSPSNKSGSGRSEYLQKRDALIDQPVNLVEIDLLLGGRPMPMGKNLPAGHYHAIVAHHREQAGCPGLRLDHPARSATNPDPSPCARRGREARPGSTFRLDLPPRAVRQDRAPWFPTTG